jgi:hypothetical protein
MDWRCGLSGRMPTLQAQSPEFKTQSHLNEKCFNYVLGLTVLSKMQNDWKLHKHLTKENG